MNSDGVERERSGNAGGNRVQRREGHGLAGSRRQGIVGNPPRSRNEGRGNSRGDEACEFRMAIQYAVNAGYGAAQLGVAKVEANARLVQARTRKSLVDPLQHFGKRFFPARRERGEQSDAHLFAPNRALWTALLTVVLVHVFDTAGPKRTIRSLCRMVRSRGLATHA